MGDDNIEKELKKNDRSKSDDNSHDDKALLPTDPFPSTPDLAKTVNPVRPANQFTGPPPTAPVKVIQPIQVPAQQLKPSVTQESSLIEDFKETSAYITTTTKEIFSASASETTAETTTSDKIMADFTATPQDQFTNMATISTSERNHHAPMVITTTLLSLFILLLLFAVFMKRFLIVGSKKLKARIFNRNSMRDDDEDMLYPQFVSTDGKYLLAQDSSKELKNSSGSIISPVSDSSSIMTPSMFGIPVLTLPRQVHLPTSPQKSVPMEMLTHESNSRAKIDGEFTITRDSTIYLEKL
jgi:hypothetical protein